MSQLRIAAIHALPAEIALLAQAARAEGFRFIDRLLGEFASGDNRFDQAGEVLLAVWRDGVLLAVGGVNADPFAAEGRTGRLRRCYVHPDHRAQGVGRELVQALEAHAASHFDSLRLFTDTRAAARFYRQLGYQPIAGDAHASHGKHLR